MLMSTRHQSVRISLPENLNSENLFNPLWKASDINRSGLRKHTASNARYRDYDEDESMKSGFKARHKTTFDLWSS